MIALYLDMRNLNISSSVHFPFTLMMTISLYFFLKSSLDTVELSFQGEAVIVVLVFRSSMDL